MDASLIIRALLDAVIAADSDPQSGFFFTLERLPQFPQVTTEFISLLSRDSQKPSDSAISIFIKYLLVKSELIRDLPDQLPLECLKTLLRNARELKAFTDCDDYAQVLTLLTSAACSETAVFAAIHGSNADPVIPFLALATVHRRFQGQFTASLCLNFRCDVLILSAATLFLRATRMEDLDESVREIMGKPEFTALILENFEKCITGVDQELMGIGFRLFGAWLHFSPIRDVAVFCRRTSEPICKAGQQAGSSERYLLLRSFCNFPIANPTRFEKFEKQYSSDVIMPLFSAAFGKFDDRVAQCLADFAQKRSEFSDFSDWLRELLQKRQTLMSAVFLVWRYGLLREFSDMVFQSDVNSPTFDLAAVAVCSVTVDLSAKGALDIFFQERALRTVLTSFAANHPRLDVGRPTALHSICDAPTLEPSIVFHVVLECLQFYIDSPRIADFHTILERFAARLVGREIQPVPRTNIVQQCYNVLQLYIETPSSSPLSPIYLFMLWFVHAAVDGRVDEMDGLVELSLTDICDRLIPLSIMDEIQKLALEDSHPVGAVIAVSLPRTSRPNPGEIIDRVVNADPMNTILFERFFQSAVRQSNARAALDEFMRLMSTPKVSRKAGGAHRMYTPVFESDSVRFPPALVMKTMNGMILDAIAPNDIAQLLLIFEIYQQDDVEAHDVLAKLVRTHQKATMSSNLIETVVTSPRFVDLLADFLYMIPNPVPELATRCFEAVFNAHTFHPFPSFCKSCLDNFGPEILPTLLSLLMEKPFDDRVLLFAEDLCLTAPIASSPEIPVLVVRLASVLLSDEFDVRRASQSIFLSIFPDRNPWIKATNSLPRGELVVETVRFCRRIASHIRLDVAREMADRIATVPVLTLGHVIFLDSLAGVHRFDLFSGGAILTHLLAQAGTGDQALAAMIEGLLVHVATADMGKILTFLLERKTTPFITDVVAALIASPDTHLRCLEQWLPALTSLVLTEDSAKTAAFALLPFLTKCCSGRDDFALLWALLVAFLACVLALPSFPQVPDHLRNIDGCFTAVFARHAAAFAGVVPSASLPGLSEQMAASFLGLGFSDLTMFIENRTILDLKRGMSSTLITFVTFVFISLFEKTKATADPIVQLLAKHIALLTVVGKDDCCRAITKRLARLWDVQDLRLFDEEGIAHLQAAGIRSLIKAQEDSQKENLHFLSKVLVVAPPTVIKRERTKLLDTLQRCFEFQTFENLLEAIHAILACGSQIEDINNMSVISLPRILTLSVSENSQIRAKANAILRFFSQAKEDGGIIPGLVRVLGLQEVGVLANFFLDWTAKVDLNVFSMALLGKLFEALAPDPMVVEFSKKAAPQLLKVLASTDTKNSADRLRVAAFDLLTRLLC